MCVVPVLRLERRLSGSEPLVLPLDDSGLAGTSRLARELTASKAGFLL